MTQRKPPETSWETWIDAQIRVAREDGAFDNLPGAGKPLPNLGEDPLLRWQKQLFQREQITIPLPPSLELLRKVKEVLATIEKLPDEATVRRRIAALNVEIAKVNATVVEGPPTRLGTLDVDQVVAQWQRRDEARDRREDRQGADVSGSRNWVVVWTDVHYGQEFVSDEGSQEAALAEADDLLRVGHTVKSIVGPDGVALGRDEIERHFHARPPPP